MVKKSKTGKSREDKFYKLAKEIGYRSRASFKLLQLNRQFGFLEKSRAILDLCAAPGGWLQVASQNCPISSIIVGVDLVPIRPIRNVSTLQSDITTDKCKQAIKKEIRDWKLDCVLHDGAPNVGTNWLHDAYKQAELTLYAIRLAHSFLRPGGWFITKVFRSKDYNSILWVCQQLFKNVHATKPQASRAESAEIFLVCQNYIAPDRLDSKFFDPRHVFKDVEDAEKKASMPPINLLKPEKRPRHSEGYLEGDYTLYHRLNVSEFVTSEDFMDLLANTSEIVLDDDRITNHALTTQEILVCCRDIKVLGRKDIKLLLAWRQKMALYLETLPSKTAEIENKSKNKDGKEELDEEDDEEKEDDEDKDEDAELQKQLSKAQKEDSRAAKRKLKKARRERGKIQHRIDMRMVIPNDVPDHIEDVELFKLRRIKNKKELNAVHDSHDHFEDARYGVYLGESDEEGKDKDSVLQRIYYDRDGQEHIQEYDDDLLDDDEDEGADDGDLHGSGSEDGAVEEEANKTRIPDEDKNPLLASLETKNEATTRKMDLWFNKASLAALDDEEDEEMEVEKMTQNYKLVTDKKKEVLKKMKKKKKKKGYDSSSSEESDDDEEEEEEVEEKVDDVKADEDDDVPENKALEKILDSTRPKKKKLTTDSDKDSPGFEIVPAEEPLDHNLDAVGLAIGAAMATSRKRRREIIEESYNRYAFDDNALPGWFSSEENKHNKKQMPVTKEEVNEYKERMKAIDARPIKKVAEAKFRKKRKETKRLERVRKKSASITDAIDVSEREKWQQIKQMYKKAGLLNQKKKDITYVVAKKSVQKRVHRPAGVKGPFRVVDPRMKKDNRAQKLQSKLASKGVKKDKTGIRRPMGRRGKK